jgi:hypothetical protein
MLSTYQDEKGSERSRALGAFFIFWGAILSRLRPSGSENPGRAARVRMYYPRSVLGRFDFELLIMFS